MPDVWDTKRVIRASNRVWRKIDTGGRRSLAAIVTACIVLAAVVSAIVVACSRDGDGRASSFEVRGEVPATGAPFALALYQSLGVQLRSGHEITMVSNGAVFDRIAEEIDRARSSVHVLLFIWQKGAASDRVLHALTERARAGVACRVLVDDVGSPGFDKDIRPALEAAGCEVRVFRRLPGAGDKLARNHRKVVVIDGRVAFTGGFGVRDEWLGDGVTAEGWRDTNVRFTGPAVAEAQQAIAENWQEAGGTLFPADAFPPPEATGSTSAVFLASTVSPVVTRAERLVQLMIQSAKKRLWIANAYFVPPDVILETMKSKAASGVDVRLLVPGTKSDSTLSMGSQHLEYGSLVKGGVRVFEYQPSMMHAKTMLVDDEVSLVSSINLEPLSLSKSEEVALVVQDRAFAVQMAESFERDCSHARIVDAD